MPKGYSNSETDGNLTLNACGAGATVANKRLSPRDCSTCRDSRGLITRTTRSFLSGRRRACLRRARDAHATNPPQDQSILDSCAAAGIVSLPGNQGGFVFCAGGSISPPLPPSPLDSCAAPRPDKLRAYKCSIRRRRLIVCASVCFHPGASSTGIIISRTRLRTESISGECGIIPIDSLCRAAGTIVLNLSCGKKCCCTAE